MRWAKKITISVLLVAVTALVGWDVYVATNDVGGDTISEIVLSVSYQYSSLPLALGIVAGHLVWPRERPIFWEKPWTVFFAGGLVLAFLGVELLFTFTIVPIIPLLPGILLGHWLWPQRPSSLMSS